MRKFTRISAITAIAAALALATTSCSSGTPTQSTASGSSTEKVTLTYWGGNNIDKIAADWNKTHPNVQVKAVALTNGAPATTKLLTAIKAGNGAPDVMSTEYYNLPLLVSQNALADVSKEGASSLESTYSKSTWDAVTLGGHAVYGLPGDIGPMMFYYRKDVFKKLGLSVPTTWDEYAAAAKKIHDADSSQYLGTFTGADGSVFAALTQQLRSSWYGTSGDAWTVNINSAANQKVAKYWGDLVQQGVIDNQPFFTPQWNSGLAKGTQVGWIAPVWGAGVIGSSAPKTKGDWAAAPMPVWDKSKPASGNWGGQAFVVPAQSKHQQQAYEFAKWVTSSADGLKSFVTNAGVYPAATNKQGSTSTPPAFLSDQSDFYDIAQKSADETPAVTFGPNVNVAYNSYVDSFGPAVKSKQSANFVSALAAMQSTTVSDLKKSGFTVK